MASQSFVSDIQAMNAQQIQVQNGKVQVSLTPKATVATQQQHATISITPQQSAISVTPQRSVITPQHSIVTQQHAGITASQQQHSATQQHTAAPQHTVTVQPSQSHTAAATQQTHYIVTNSQGQSTTMIQPSAHSNNAGQAHYIVTTVTDGEQSSGNHDQGNTHTVYPSHIQYVDANDTPVYASANGQMQNNYGEYNQAMYTPVSGAYYQTSGTAVSSQLASLPVGSVQPGQLISHQGGTYLVQGGTMDGEGTPLTHTTRASPATVQWLIENYETAEGVSLPRCTMYNHYLRHCQEHTLDPMNPASFGKLIRSVFLGLRTRRLGTRGNSKYHYYGIRIKAASHLNQMTDEQTMAMRHQPLIHGKSRPKHDWTTEDTGTTTSGVAATSAPVEPTNTHQQFLGDASGAIPNLGDVDTTGYPLPPGITKEHVHIFESMYKDHAEAILDVVINLQFPLIETLWQSFWRHTSVELPMRGPSEYEKSLPREILFVLCKYEPILTFVRRSDYAFYQALVEVLIPDVLRPIPSSLTQAIRNFAKSLEGWLKGAMVNVPESMYKTKLTAVSAFAQTLRRYTSLNHLAQAARAVLQNTSQINQMLADLNRVDFANVQEQASWVCQCDDSVVHQLEQDFKKTLQQQNTLEQWAVWLESVVNQILNTHEGSSNFPKAARQFLLKWSFYSSMVIRDLTLRSAASFGSFHLIRLLYDEYMFYLVEHKVAASTGETPIAVMGEIRQMADGGMSNSDSEDPDADKPFSPSSTPVSSNPTPSSINSVVLPSGETIHVLPSDATNLMSALQSSNLGHNLNQINNNATISLLTAAQANMNNKTTFVVMPMGSGDANHDPKRLKVE